jgi:TPR repeat protein
VRTIKSDVLPAAQAAKQGDAGMMLLLSQMLKSGYGCPCNEEQSAYWHSKAATLMEIVVSEGDSSA